MKRKLKKKKEKITFIIWNFSGIVLGFILIDCRVKQKWTTDNGRQNGHGQTGAERWGKRVRDREEEAAETEILQALDKQQRQQQYIVAATVKAVYAGQPAPSSNFYVCVYVCVCVCQALILSCFKIHTHIHTDT